MTALGEWAAALAAWRVPQEILDASPEPPLPFSVEQFAARARAAIAAPPTPSIARAHEALPDGGTLLDVGVGGGAASLPHAGHAGLVVGVDGMKEMLDAFRELAAELGVRAAAFEGPWPNIASMVNPADVVVCHHVLYNVADLRPFVEALTDHAKRRVVVEITAEHPVRWMNDLWLRFHGLERPDRPTADDAFAALRERGLPVQRQDWPGEESWGGFSTREDAVDAIRRRLLLPADRRDEVAGALGGRLREFDGRWSSVPNDRRLVTLWWDA